MICDSSPLAANSQPIAASENELALRTLLDGKIIDACGGRGQEKQGEKRQDREPAASNLQSTNLQSTNLQS
ncbi:MAG: hypothetical protein ACOC8X_03820, partial [Chloroflexota bacterium]